MARIRAGLREHGFIHVTGLPRDFDPVQGLRPLGSPMAQYNGSLTRDVTPDPAMPDSEVSVCNLAALPPHTECVEFPGRPPRYVALWCLRAAEGPGGETTLADGHRMLEHFSPAELEGLRRNVYRWNSNPTLVRQGISMSAEHPVLEEDADDRLIRYSSIGLHAEDELLKKYLEVGREYFSDESIAIRFEQGSLLIWDNWRMLHGRNAFTDRRRHLRRIVLA